MPRATKRARGRYRCPGEFLVAAVILSCFVYNNVSSPKKTMSVGGAPRSPSNVWSLKEHLETKSRVLENEAEKEKSEGGAESDENDDEAGDVREKVAFQKVELDATEHEPSASAKAVIGYAITVTDCQAGGTFLDNAAVVHHSVYLSSIRNNETGTPPSKYDFKMYAFVHPDATSCSRGLSKLGYEVQERPTPVEVKDMNNEDLQKATDNGCCGAKEFMKLYSYLLPHPVVVHLDVDCLVMKPMDALYDAMMLPGYTIEPGEPDPVKDSLSVMWPDEYYTPSESGSGLYRQPIDFFFTRDYNMVTPPRRQPDQIGVQGGFLVVRPNATDFERYMNIIRTGGDYKKGAGWGGPKLNYGGYYGTATVQGLASFYHGKGYSMENKRRAVELNRCYYNNMADRNRPKRVGAKDDNDRMCATLQPDDECQDCRETDISKIITAHFTLCQKPQLCSISAFLKKVNSMDVSDISPDDRPYICLKLHNEWHRIRYSLEQKWAKSTKDYEPSIREPVVTWNDTSELPKRGPSAVITKLFRNAATDNYVRTHCDTRRGGKPSYLNLAFPPLFHDENSIEAVL